MNPYSFEDPVTDQKMFYGYHNEVKKIVERVTEQWSFFVLGGPRMGKTSLLQQVEHGLEALGKKNTSRNARQLVIPLYLDMRDIPATDKDFFGKVAKKLEQFLDEHIFAHAIPSEVKISLDSVENAAEPFDSFAAVLLEITEVMKPKELRLVLLVDDLWRKLGSETEIIFPRILRALLTPSEINYAVASVFTGSFYDLGVIGSSASPLENVLFDQSLHVLNKAQTLLLINEPTQNKIPAEVTQEIYQETGGHPFLIQYIMSHLYDREDWAYVTTEDVGQVIVKFEEEREDFKDWFKKLSEIDRKVYKVFCQVELGMETQICIDDLLHMMKFDIPNVNWPVIRDALNALATTGLIRETNEDCYELAGQWPARWFRRMW